MLAVDLGATSVRVASVDLASPIPEVKVVHRWHHGPVEGADSHLRWDWPGIVAQVKTGLEMALATGPAASIGVDGWGVDYGLLDERDRLLDMPFSYRDQRTADWRATAARIGAPDLYSISGIQLMGINTIFQLANEERGRLNSARRLLLLPDLLVHELTGFAAAEVSNMSTTSLMNARTHDWSDELIAAAGAPRSLFPDPVTAGSHAGSWRGVPVTVVGSHDTASAFLGAPGGGTVAGAAPGNGSAGAKAPRGETSAGSGRAGRDIFVSAGSWVLVGTELAEPDTSEEARQLNFSNEAGALGGVRFLKNVVGFWVLERCRAAWGDPDISELIAEAALVTEPVPRFDASDHRFVGPVDMVAEVLAASGLSPATPRAVVARCVLESIVEGIFGVIGELERVCREPLGRLVLVGGGARIALFVALLRDRTGRAVVVGSPESTALGNAVVQGIALGRFADRGEASEWLAKVEVVA